MKKSFLWEALGENLSYRHVNLVLIYNATEEFSRLCFTQAYFIEKFVFDKTLM